ncbi:MAG: hypothetical protein K6E75_12835 [Lachnospiraceae bacterium]|nr:hypothetical protein [Lachnospiraceae bacterium]
MQLKDMTDLIKVYDAVVKLEEMAGLLTGNMVPEEGTILESLYAILDVIDRNSVVLQKESKDPMFDECESMHEEILNDTKLSAEQRALRLLDICSQA